MTRMSRAVSSHPMFFFSFLHFVKGGKKEGGEKSQCKFETVDTPSVSTPCSHSKI